VCNTARKKRGRKQPRLDAPGRLCQPIPTQEPWIRSYSAFQCRRRRHSGSAPDYGKHLRVLDIRYCDPGGYLSAGNLTGFNEGNSFVVHVASSSEREPPLARTPDAIVAKASSATRRIRALNSCISDILAIPITPLQSYHSRQHI